VSDSGVTKDSGGGKVDAGSHDSGKANFCEGGFVRNVEGGAPTCEGLCKPSLCTNANNICVNNDCALQCTSDLDCAQGQTCAAAIEDGSGASVTTCQASKQPTIGTPCPNGTECANLKTCGDGTPCPDSGTCAVGTCQALQCLSSGVGDETAYCTRLDCRADTDCPGGFWCEQVRDPHSICGQPPTNSMVCGNTTDNCVDAGTDAATSTTYTAGAVCTQRNVCVIRRQCDPCATDLDCARVRGQVCVSGSCAEPCATDGDCVLGFKCTAGNCQPRSGSCTSPTGKGAVCDSCRIDSDCGPNMICVAFETGGERVCALAPNNPITCMSDMDCPASPSGAHVVCLGAAEDLTPQELGYDTCGYAPFSTAANAYQCWPGNPGAACLVASDCADGACVGVIPAVIAFADGGLTDGGDASVVVQPAQAGNCK
jgi:hypothetical protein